MNTTHSKFAILFTGRSGSSYLTSMLDSHPNIICEGEMLAQIVHVGEPPEKQLAWSRQFYDSARPQDIRSVGYKTKLSDVVDPGGFRRLLDDLGVRLIHLIRRNLVKQVISALNAERLHQKTGQWNIQDEGERLGPFSVDEKTFDSLLKNRMAGEKKLAESIAEIGRSAKQVVYEDLLRKPDETLQDLYDFLDVPSRPVVSQFRKHTPDDLRAVVTNFDELKQRYAGTRFEAMFDEI